MSSLLITTNESGEVVIPDPGLSGKFITTEREGTFVAYVAKVDADIVATKFTEFVNVFPGIKDLGTVTTICKSLLTAIPKLIKTEPNTVKRLQLVITRDEGKTELYNPETFQRELIYTYPLKFS